MKEENPSENRVKSSKFMDENQVPKGTANNNVKANSNFSRMKSSWSSHIVKGFSAADKKTKTRVLQATAHKTKMPLTGSDNANQKNQPVCPNSRTKRSLIDDLSCSIYANQVHPQTVQDQNQTKSLGSSEDLFIEIDHLRKSLQESKDRELQLEVELSENKRNPNLLQLEKELESKKSEVDGLVKKVGLLEAEKEKLSEQLVCLESARVKQDEMLEKKGHDKLSDLEMEVVELRRLNKELQLEKRNLICKISSLESHLTTLAKVSQTEILENIKAEASLLKHTNEDLCKQVEGLQTSRMNEVEELVYLRWVNSCLRDELRYRSSTSSDRNSSLDSVDESGESISVSTVHIDDDSDSSAARRYLIKKLKKWPITDDDLQRSKYTDDLNDCSLDNSQCSTRRHSISGTNCSSENIILNKRRLSDGFIGDKGLEIVVSKKYDLEVNKSPLGYTSCQEVRQMTTAPPDVKKRALRIPNPPPRPSSTVLITQKDESSAPSAPQSLPPRPPPPPPPPKLMARGTVGKVQRSPQVVEFYHSLMKRDSRKDCQSSGTTDSPEVANVRSSMIGEIENRSSHLLAIKADVETQGEFVNSLIREVNNAAYQNIEDVVAFVKWLDDELCFLVDERAVLKHFDWPEKKADTLREAAFVYRDLKKLEQEISNYKDELRLPCDLALKKMAALSERMERTVYNILRTRDSLMRNCKEFLIPTDWMLDIGILNKIKFGSVKLAKMYMKRVAVEIQFKGTSDKDSSLDYMLLHGVRFAFRIHQFAGGFDAETMHAFEELRQLAVGLNKDTETEKHETG